MRLIDLDQIEFLKVDGNKEFNHGVDCCINKLLEAEPIEVVSLDKLKQVIKQIIDEKDFAYADFDRYKEEVLYVEPDELPDDDFRYGMERCLEVLNMLIERGEE